MNDKPACLQGSSNSIIGLRIMLQCNMQGVFMNARCIRTHHGSHKTQTKYMKTKN